MIELSTPAASGLELDTTAGRQPVPPTWLAALGELRALDARYHVAGRSTESSTDHAAADLVAAALRLVAALAGPDSGRLLEWAMRRAPTNKLLRVATATRALQHGGRDRAATLLERALSLDSEDLHAQHLLLSLRAAGRPPADLRDRFCQRPFENLETQVGGKAYFCCPSWLPVPIGNLAADSADAVWNSTAAQDIRRSVLDGSFRYCSRMHCPKLTADALPRRAALGERHRRIVREGRTRLAEGPRHVSLCHDRSCNLSCPSCRTAIIVARKQEQDELDAFARRILLPLLADARGVNVTGSGDPFASAHFRRLLKMLAGARLPHLKIDLQTNGLLLKSSWDELAIEDLIERVHVSVDAARAPTYAVLRRGGSFAQLLDNLAFLATLRRAGRVARVRLDFVVQALNYREMPEVVDLMRRFGFDGIKFQMIRSWGTYAPEAFERHNIGSPDHPEHAAFRRTLGDPRLRAPGLEFWGFRP